MAKLVTEETHYDLRDEKGQVQYRTLAMAARSIMRDGYD